MTFQEIADRFERSGSGSDAFKALSRSAFDLMKEDSQNAALFFVIGVAAKSYVRVYEDQAVTEAVAERAKTILSGYAAKVVQALADEPATRFRLLSEISFDYEWQVADF